MRSDWGHSGEQWGYTGTTLGYSGAILGDTEGTPLLGYTGGHSGGTAKNNGIRLGAFWDYNGIYSSHTGECQYHTEEKHGDTGPHQGTRGILQALWGMLGLY